MLIGNLHRREADLRALLNASSDHWGFEDPVYRFYHQSFKVYSLQSQTEAICTELALLSPPACQFDPWFAELVQEGTGKAFRPEDNAHWTRVTRPILEVFFHARFFLEMAVRYAWLQEPPNPLPSGYAALLCLYGLR